MALARVLKTANELGYTVLITADHGNADQMLDKNKKGEYSIRTAHSLNPVPFIIYSAEKSYTLDTNGSFGLANVAPTVAEILGITPYSTWEKSMLK